MVVEHAAGYISTPTPQRVHGTYRKASLRRAGLDPDNLTTSDASQMSFGTAQEARRHLGRARHRGVGAGRRRANWSARGREDTIRAEAARSPR